MSTDKYLPYRGEVKAVLGLGGTLVFVTIHAEDHPTAVYRLNADKLTLTEDALPRGGVALLADGDTLWVGGSDGQVYQLPEKGGKPFARGPKFDTPPTALALLSDERLAVLTDKQINILARKDGKLRQTLELPDSGTAIAADPTGQWLVAGTAKGTIAVFDSEEKPDFLLGESSRLHEGAVTALLFESEELRFLSAGADQKLLLTHARGKLEPEDKGRGNNHTDVVSALLWGPGDRFYSGSRDATLKSWPRTGNLRPASLKDGIRAVTALALVDIHNRPHLVAACADNSLRLVLIDAAGKFGDVTTKIRDAYAQARNEFAQDDPRARETALKTLAAFDDTAAIELIAAQVNEDADHALRLLAVQLLGKTNHAHAPKYLEAAIKHRDEAVRVAALQGLRRHRGEDNLGPLTLALKAAKPDIGRIAVESLEKLAKRDDQALALLVKALNARTPEVRQAALASLEKVHGNTSPEASLVALASQHADTRRLALVRLFQRKLLTAARVPAALRRCADDEDGEVRRTAFLVSLFLRDKLVAALRGRDAELHRQLVELETHGKEAPAEEKEKKEKKDKPAKTREVKLNLDDADHEPLLQATASRALDTCLRGARGLAVLGDARAFGLLLQLSREKLPQARADVCRALAALDDARSINRLRSLLYDTDAGVRDAAFTALAQIHTDDPLLAAEAGLNSSFEDVRRRGLQALISSMRKAAAKSDARATGLLVYALNDSFVGVRTEAFKSALNLQIGGGGVQTLRFVLQSVHADVRREVLTEVMAQSQEAWAWALLLEFFDDHDPKLRDEAFQFAVKKSKELAPLEVALRSQYADVRKQAVAALIKKHTQAAQTLLVKALADPEKEVRQLALDSLVSSDAVTPLTQALDSPHPDVRVRAARALARHGASSALAPLLALATAPEPAERERQGDWSQLVEAALDGLGELGDSSSLPHITPLLNSNYPNLRKAAANALSWVALPNHAEALRQALHHSDPQVKYAAALGLAYAGDPFGASLVFSKEGGKNLSPAQYLIAALTLGPAGEDHLINFLDDPEPSFRDQALFLLMLRELRAHQGTPTRCLAGLSSLMPRVRLTAASALEAFADPQAFLGFVVQLLSDRGEGQPWQLPAQTVQSLAELLVNGSPQLRARTAHLVRFLVKTESEAGEKGARAAAEAKEEDAWNRVWNVHAQRFAAEIKGLLEKAATRKPVASQFTQGQLQQLAFGAYVGLVREQGGDGQGQRPQVIRIRQTALHRILALAKADAGYAAAARPVLVQALGDPNQAVRLLAFEHLQTLGVEPAALAADALEAGHTDLGIRGLELLTGKASAAEGRKVLEQAMLTRTDELSIEAAKRLMKQRGVVPVASLALTAAHEETRHAAIGWLASRYDKVEAAREQLRKALESRYRKVRRSAAFALATRKDPAAFPALVQILKDAEDADKQRRVIEALVTLGDPRSPDAFLDRLANDPSGTADADALLSAAGNFRRPETTDRLLALMEKDAERREAAFRAVLTISGHDQDIDDVEDEKPNRSWEKEQFPRHDAIFARLFEGALHIGMTDSLGELIPAARWSRGKDVDPVMALLSNHPDENLRQLAVEAVGWRLRKRGGPAEALTRALQHKDPVTQFIAAEGLARAGRSDGLTVLLSAADFMSDLDLRKRAVRALGELADMRALDALLRLASEDGHALQEDAAEAIGHMGKSARAEDIFKLLERFAKGEDGIALKALWGLRWLNTHAGWQLIRKRTGDVNWRTRSIAVELLGYNDDPATRDLLLRLLVNEAVSMVLGVAHNSARRIWGSESLEPEYALLQNRAATSVRIDGERVRDKILKRVCEQGEPRRLFEILARCPDDAQQALATSLLNRPALPVAEARAALDSTDERTARLAAQIVGRAGTTAEAGKPVAAALQRWLAVWQQRRDQMAQQGETDTDRVEETTPVIESLIWAAGRVGVPERPLLDVVVARPDDPHYRPIRLAAVAALLSGKLTKAALDALETVARGDDPEARTLAADGLGRNDPARAAKLAEHALSDRVSFNRLAAGDGARLTSTLHSAATKVHYQGVALPHLIAQKDVAALAAVALDKALPEATRLGAIEGLAVLAVEPAEAWLKEIGQAPKEDEELRKAAWRALRRSKRARQPHAEVKA